MKIIFTFLISAIILTGCASTQFTGNTLASKVLRNDTFKTLFPYATAKLNCGKISSINTKTLSTSKSGAVKERWVAQGCDKTAPFIITYTPDAKGVSINITPE